MLGRQSQLKSCDQVTHILSVHTKNMGLKSLQFLASSCVVSNFLLLVFGNQVGNCSKINFIEQVYGKQTDLGFCPKRNETAQVKMLARSMKEWHFHEKQILLETFAIDTERRNFVRKVSGTLFSLVKPTPLKSDIKLAAFSSEVLEHILDMDSEQMKTDKEFLKVWQTQRWIIKWVDLPCDKLVQNNAQRYTDEVYCECFVALRY